VEPVREAQTPGDLLVCQPGRDQCGHVTLSWGQHRRPRDAMALMVPFGSARGQARLLYSNPKIDRVNVTVSPSNERRQHALTRAMGSAGERSSNRWPISAYGMTTTTPTGRR
jgi:hypothetical protein